LCFCYSRETNTGLVPLNRPRSPVSKFLSTHNNFLPISLDTKEKKSSWNSTVNTLRSTGLRYLGGGGQYFGPSTE
jgi:hypothetical protein